MPYLVETIEAPVVVRRNNTSKNIQQNQQVKNTSSHVEAGISQFSSNTWIFPCDCPTAVVRLNGQQVLM
jgi:hypothetical protein